MPQKAIRDDMFNPSGSVTVNGITDKELAEILEVKAKHQPNVFNFNPQQLQPVYQNNQSWYNGAVFVWNSEQGLEVTQSIIHMLLKKEEQAKAQQ